MKKSFTLIELLVTLTVGLIFFQFLFSFKFNFLKELQDIQRQNELAKNTYHSGQILSKGFMYKSTTFPGIITLDTYNNTGRFRSYDSNTRVDYSYKNIDGNRYSQIEVPGETYRINKFFTPKNNTAQIKGELQIEDTLDFTGTTALQFYYTTFDAVDKNNSDIKYDQYIKLVYAR